MKIKLEDVRPPDRTKKIEITEYLPAGVVPEGKKVFLTIKRLTMAEKDKNAATMATALRTDTRNATTRYEGDAWFYENHMRVLLAGVDHGADDFPFERWDRKQIELIDNTTVGLLEFVYQEIEDFNRPLADKRK